MWWQATCAAISALDTSGDLPTLNYFDGGWKKLPKIRKMYLSQPLEGIAEVTVTLRFDQRVRALVLRFEGVEKRWICTKMELL